MSFTTHSPSRLGAQGYGWIHLLGVAYCVLIGVFSVSAWAADGKPFEAALCAGAQVLAIVFAVLGRRAFNGDVSASGMLCVAISGGCAYWAAKGIANAWAASGETAEPAMIWLLAALEPLLFLLAEHIEQANARKAAERRRAEAEQNAALEAARAANAEREAREHERKLAEIAAASGGNVTRLPVNRPARRAASAAVKVGVGGAVAMTGAAAAQTPGQATPSPTPQRAACHAAVHAGADARVAQAWALKGRGMTQPEVAAELGVSVRTVARLWARAKAETADALAGAA